MADLGWISLHRKIKDHKFWKEKRVFSKFEAWIDILLSVNHAPADLLINGQNIHIETGQMLTSILELASRWSWSRFKVSSFLNALEADESLHQKRTSKYTLLTVVNWAFYQVGASENQHQKYNKNATEIQQTNIKPTSKIHQKNTNNNVDNNNNEDNENKKDIVRPTRHHYGEYQNVLLSDDELAKVQAEYPLDWQARIERLSEYMASTGKSYKSHLATIRAWARKDNPKEQSGSYDYKQKQEGEPWWARYERMQDYILEHAPEMEWQRRPIPDDKTGLQDKFDYKQRIEWTCSEVIRGQKERGEEIIINGKRIGENS